jgi:protein-tyrosine phosphatase
MPDHPYTRLPLQRAYNVRDLGGYACAQGKTTRWRTYLRGDNLAFLENEDITFLKEYGLKTVIDLRSADELTSFPNPFELDEEITYHNIPLMAGNIGDITRELAGKPAQFLPLFYTMLLDQGKGNLKKVLDVIADHTTGALLFHCTAGKDSTGILSMLLLSIAGVADVDIISNYCITAHYNKENPRIQKQMHVTPAEVLASSPEYIITTMGYLDAKYGSREFYLQAIGVDQANIERIRTHFCTQ